MKKSKLRFLTCLAICALCMSAFSVTAFAGIDQEYAEPVLEYGEPLSQEMDIVTRDLLYDKATNKQFITIEDRDGNIFYLVIDYDAPVNEDEEQYKTYFLNPVDTDDLMALTGKEQSKPLACNCKDKCVAGAVNISCPVCTANMTECAGKEEVAAKPEQAPATEPQPEGIDNRAATAILALLLVAILAGMIAIVKIVKNQPKAKAPADLFDYDYDDDEEEAEDEEGEDR